jgi:hypothetical protein
MESRLDHRQFLRWLFFASETLFLGSVIIMDALCRFEAHHPYEDARLGTVAGAIFWLSLIMLPIVCFQLRQAARLLAIAGWSTVVAVLIYGMMSPCF